MNKKTIVTNILSFALIGLMVVALTSCRKPAKRVVNKQHKGTTVLTPSPVKKVETEDNVALLKDKGYFDYDSSVIRPDTAKIIKKFAEWMEDNDDATLRIEGHADERGTREYNLALGARRANAAKRYIVAMGIAPNRIKTVSYGKERPADPRSNAEAWAKNRRFVALKIQ